MNALKYAGVAFLALIWLWLVWLLLSQGGVTFKNIFLAVASGTIIFVPLWKKHSAQSNQ